MADEDVPMSNEGVEELNDRGEEALTSGLKKLVIVCIAAFICQCL